MRISSWAGIERPQCTFDKAQRSRPEALGGGAACVLPFSGQCTGLALDRDGPTAARTVAGGVAETLLHATPSVSAASIDRLMTALTTFASSLLLAAAKGAQPIQHCRDNRNWPFSIPLAKLFVWAETRAGATGSLMRPLTQPGRQWSCCRERPSGSEPPTAIPPTSNRPGGGGLASQRCLTE